MLEVEIIDLIQVLHQIQDVQTQLEINFDPQHRNVGSPFPLNPCSGIENAILKQKSNIERTHCVN